jgi:hypothetical protein
MQLPPVIPTETLGPVPWDGSLVGNRGPWGPIARSTLFTLWVAPRKTPTREFAEPHG